MRILHFNDEEKKLHAYLSERGHLNDVFGTEDDPFARASETSYDAAFIGLHPHGLQLIRFLHRRNPDCLVTMVTADSNARTAVEAMKLGAFDYLFTPLDFTEVERTVLMLTREHQSQQERKNLEGRLADAVAPETSPIEPGEPSAGSLRDILSLVERQAIEKALTENQGNIARAARVLCISRTTLYAKLRMKDTAGG